MRSIVARGVNFGMVVAYMISAERLTKKQVRHSRKAQVLAMEALAAS